MEYSEKVLEHFAHPHNVGKIEDADGIGEVGNAKCGDIMKMYIKVNAGIFPTSQIAACMDTGCACCSLYLENFLLVPAQNPSVPYEADFQPPEGRV